MDSIKRMKRAARIRKDNRWIKGRNKFITASVKIERKMLRRAYSITKKACMKYELQRRRDERDFPCDQCEDGEMIAGYPQPNGQEPHTCNSCGYTISFP